MSHRSVRDVPPTNRKIGIGPIANRSLFVLPSLRPPAGRFDTIRELPMQHDLRLRAAARAIYDACYPSDDWARCVLAARGEQLTLAVLP